MELWPNKIWICVSQNNVEITFLVEISVIGLETGKKKKTNFQSKFKCFYSWKYNLKYIDMPVILYVNQMSILKKIKTKSNFASCIEFEDFYVSTWSVSAWNMYWKSLSVNTHPEFHHTSGLGWLQTPPSLPWFIPKSHQGGQKASKPQLTVFYERA